jgi:AraC family transcriptional regulator of adaptative response / DNA-3-methyladenine glycosylase II
LRLTVHASAPADLYALVERARALFDLGADPEVIAAHLARDPELARAVGAHPGLRVPGAWDPFELAVRAILGQQVTVAGATTLAGRLVRAFGEPVGRRGLEDPRGGLTHFFPKPRVLARADLTSIGLPKVRAAALSVLARKLDSGELVLDSAAGLDVIVQRLTALPGVGPWTAHYVAMRALGEPDAFPSSDLGLRRAVSRRRSARNGKRGDPRASVTPAQLEARAEAWRPWRAYAAMHLWTRSNGIV